MLSEFVLHNIFGKPVSPNLNIKFILKSKYWQKTHIPI